MSFNKLRRFSLSSALLIFSLVISLLCAELAIRSIAPQNLSGTWRVATDKGLLVNKSFGTSRHQFGERVVNYTFHEPHLRDTPLTEAGVKVLVVGDSYTFGWLVNKNSTYVQRLQEYADNEFGVGQFQFLNAAAGGWGTADYVAYIEDFGESINPDIILVFLNTDDIGRSHKANIYTLAENEPLILKRNIINSSTLKKLVNTMPGYQWLLENSHLVQLARQTFLTQKSDRGGDIKEKDIGSGPNSLDLGISRHSSITLGSSLFSHLNKWCQARSIHLLVTTTGWHHLENAKTSTEPTVAFMSIADEYFRSQHIPFFDISPYISKKLTGNLEEYIIAGDGHPNESGHLLIGNTSWKMFVKSQLSEYCRISRRCT